LTETFAPPSLLLIMREESLGAIQRSWLSLCGTLMLEKVLPPSFDL
jgi:hypothetical protein